jgi:putative ABC transport system permease protein
MKSQFRTLVAHFLFLSEQQDRARVTGRFSLLGSGETTFYVRYASGLDSVGPAVRAAVRTVDERVPISNMRTMQTQLDRGNDGPRTIAAFLSLFSGGSLLIAAIGQYAVIAFEMRRRTRELGIRVAIGASARQIQTSVLKEGLVLTAIGLVIGFGLSLAAGFAFSSVLTGVTPTDARTYLGVFSVLAIASMLACYLPARRASRIDPLVTLRYE